jgi:hypothetical protein
MVFSATPLSLLLAAAATLVSGECSRETLISTRDNFFKTSAAKGTVEKVSGIPIRVIIKSVFIIR